MRAWPCSAICPIPRPAPTSFNGNGHGAQSRHVRLVQHRRGGSGQFDLGEPEPTNTPVGATPSTTLAGTPLTLVSVDQYGNPEVGVPPVSMAITAPGAALSAASTTPVNTNASGQAIFSNLIENTAGNNYTLTATIAPLAGVQSTSFNVSSLGATKLGWVNQPTNTPAGSVIDSGTGVTLQLEDPLGNPVSQANVSVTISISTGAFTTGTTTELTNASGVVAFTDLVDDTAGTYTLTATSAGLTAVPSASFMITPLAAFRLTFVSFGHERPDCRGRSSARSRCRSRTSTATWWRTATWL